MVRLLALLLFFPVFAHADTIYYGTTKHQGAYGFGAVFKNDPSTPIYSFCPLGEGRCTDGEHPNSVVQMPDGSLFGTTHDGGSGAGTIFHLWLTPSGWQRFTIRLCWYWNDCDRYGKPTGSLAIIGATHLGYPVLMGTVEGKNHGLIYKMVVGGPSGIRIWPAHHFK